MDEAASPAVTLDRASVTLGGQRILDRVDMTVPFGQITCVIGPSGCGKTTLLRLLAGLVPLSEGNMIRRARRIGVVFQEPRLLPWLTARDNVAIGMQQENLPRASQRQHAEKLLALTGLGVEEARAYPAKLSGGMASRVAFARALATKPELLLCDEPFAALDLDRRTSMQDLLMERRASTAMSVVFVTHDHAEAARIGDQTYAYCASARSFKAQEMS